MGRISEREGGILVTDSYNLCGSGNERQGLHDLSSSHESGHLIPLSLVFTVQLWGVEVLPSFYIGRTWLKSGIQGRRSKVLNRIPSTYTKRGTWITSKPPPADWLAPTCNSMLFTSASVQVWKPGRHSTHEVRSFSQCAVGMEEGLELE